MARMTDKPAMSVMITEEMTWCLLIQPRNRLKMGKPDVGLPLERKEREAGRVERRERKRGKETGLEVCGDYAVI